MGDEVKNVPQRSKKTKKDHANDSSGGNIKRKVSDGITIAGERAHTENYLLSACLLGLLVAALVHIKVRDCKSDASADKQYWVYSARSDVDNREGLLKHVHAVLERVGYTKASNASPWALLWSHDYPFGALRPALRRLRPHQLVNHFPGTGYITNKVDLATTPSKYIPKAFKLPADEADFLKYAASNKEVLFVEKDNRHRGVVVKNVSDVETRSGRRFVQRFVSRPLLVGGRRFDVGVYVLLAAVDPLRVYWYKGDVLFRYCMERYEPFDPRNVASYVVGDDYMPTWEVPELARSHARLGCSMKDSFDIYLRELGKDPLVVWTEIQVAIAEIFLKKEHHIIEALKHYSSGDNFFELMRFDFIIDEDLKVHLLEANMSPNLSSSHFPQNRLLYEQVLYNLFAITGVATYFNNNKHGDKDEDAIRDMMTSDKNIAVFGAECAGACAGCAGLCALCALCRSCAPPALSRALRRAHREHLHRGDFRRLYPPAMKPGVHHFNDSSHMTTNNKLQHLWFQGKCNDDITWCS